MGCQTKARIAIQGLQGRPVADICHEYQISQSLYDQWHEQFLAHAANAVEVHQHTRKEARLERENAALKKLLGELALELKKATGCWGKAATLPSGHAT
jgi:transposase-like protein